ncbi:hypothetical protein [Mesorhizobium sp.]|uniref:hypothetical protein n=1 Tax=Mesorhizobium sp. TaxID=1871066 RepID=UPI0025D26AE9|nr:hypothetical protein [Mesorhizobium sp.]
MLHHMLTNPVYATACAGTGMDGEILIHDHHKGYISWEEVERNQHLIADNAN